jgi:hypothetical protein
MGLPMRITFKDVDYVYQIVNSKLIDKHTTEIELIWCGEKIELLKDIKQGWILKNGDNSIDGELIQALGRSVSLRLRM